MDSESRSKSAIITGITGQDGAYLAKLLLGKGYIVHGTYRRSSTTNFWRIRELGIEQHPRLRLIEYDLTDPGSAIRLISTVRPDEVYNLAAQSFVGASYDQPVMTTQVNAVGVLNLLEAIRTVDRSIRFYQASTSEMFGKALTSPQNEDTFFHPRSPYGVAKLYAHWITVNYRESYDIFAVSGILFNHESPLRGLEFVTRKITHGVAQIRYGKKTHLTLGNLDAVRDWGYAEEYVEGMWRMLQIDHPETFVLATGQMHTVKDFATMAFEAADISVVWAGTGVETTARCERTGRTLLSIDPIHYRPIDVEHLSGDSTKAFRHLQWSAKTTTQELCTMMVRADMHRMA